MESIQVKFGEELSLKSCMDIGSEDLAVPLFAQVCLNKHRKLQCCKRMREIFCLTELSPDFLYANW